MSCPRIGSSAVIACAALVFPLRISAASAVTINEFFPDPDGSDSGEWIELYNASDADVDLSGWMLDDQEGGGSSAFIIASATAIAARSFMVFEKSETGLALNNDGDTVRLLTGEGSVVDTYTYEKSSSGISIGRSVDGGGAWVFCAAPTQRLPNNCPVPTRTPTPVPTAKQEETKSPTATATLAPPPPASPTKTPTPIVPTSWPTHTVAPRISPSVAMSDILGESVATEGMEKLQIGTESARGAPSYRPAAIFLSIIGSGLGLVATALAWKKNNTVR